MFLVRPLGVYRVDTDTSLLIDVLREGGYAASRRVLDIGTGTGALALAAARAGAASVCDTSHRRRVRSRSARGSDDDMGS